MALDHVPGQIWALAANVWREAMRDRVFYILALAGIILFLFSTVLGQMAVGGQGRVVQDMGFWVLGLWGLLSVVYLGSNIVRRELQQKTIYMILSRPVGPSTFLMGKFAGVVLVLVSVFLLLALTFFLVVLSQGIRVTVWHWVAAAFILGEWVLLAAVSLFFASFTSPILHNFFLFGVAFLGHWCNDLRLFALNAESPWVKHMLNGVYFVLPNLEALNFRQTAVYALSVDSAVLWYGVLVLGGWVAAFLIGANLVFMRRKLL